MRLYKQVYLYFLSYAVNAVLSFGTVSLLTHYLSVYDYGIINLYSSFLIFLMPFVSGGIGFPLSVEFFKKSEKEYRSYFTNAHVISVTLLFFLIGICLLFQNVLKGILNIPLFWILLAPVAAWFIMITETMSMILRSRDKALQFVLFSIGKNFLETLLTFLFVISIKLTWDGRLMSATLTPLLLGGMSIFFFYRWRLINNKINFNEIRSILLVSFPFIFERISIFVMGYSDKYFINAFSLNGTTEVGLYGLASQVSSIIYLIIISMNSAYFPHLFKKMSLGHKPKFEKETGWYIIATAIAVGGIFLCTPFIFTYFIGSSFSGAQSYVYILSGSYFMWGVYNSLLGYLLYMSKNRQILYIAVGGTIVSLISNSFLVKNYGAVGAAITSAITYTIMALTCFFYVRKYLHVKSMIQETHE